MATLIGNTNEEKIWNYFKSKGLNNFGCAGLMGNLFAESALNPKNLQNTYEKKLGYTDDEYCVAVDNGSYTNFVKDNAGFGLAQWTYWSRKQNLLDYAKSIGKSIGDLEMQLTFLYEELKESYSSILNVLKNSSSVLQASNEVLLKYERPADQSITVQNKRASYGQKYFDKYANANVSTNNKVEEVHMKIKANDLISLFKRMYEEKWKYVWGAAEEKCVDCSGAFVYAYKKLNGSYIYHGSNRIARKYVGTLQSIGNAKPGWAAFKWKKNGEPSEYTDGKGNYYHIGLVDETGKNVLHAKGTASGFCRDSISGWSYVAPLNDVDYSEIKIEEALYTAKVITKTGNLNLRAVPNGVKIGTIPRNDIVDVLNDDNDDWWRVRHNGRIGYSSTEFLVRDLQQSDNKENQDEKQSFIENCVNKFNIGDKVKLVSGAVYASGKSIPSWVFEKELYVREIQNNNVVISTLQTGAITGVVSMNSINKIGDLDSNAFPYKVKVIVNSLNVRSGAGTIYKINSVIKDRGVYTIVGEANGVGATKWLKLASGAGWIASDYTEIIK